MPSKWNFEELRQKIQHILDTSKTEEEVADRIKKLFEIKEKTPTTSKNPIGEA